MGRLPSDTLALPGQRSLQLTTAHAETGIRINASSIGTYLATYSLFRDNGHYCETATHAETGITVETKFAAGSLPSDTFSLPSQRSLLSDSNAR